MKFDETAKLGKASEDAYNWAGWVILYDLLNEWVAKGFFPTLMTLFCSIGCNDEGESFATTANLCELSTLNDSM